LRDRNQFSTICLGLLDLFASSFAQGFTMERVPNRYDDGLELHPYQGMEVHEYEGMNANRYPDANRYPGASSEEKEPLDAAIPLDNVYEEDLGSRLHRGLKTRQICMIALGGALGTGLLINT
jgi:amino acid transporter